MLEMNALRDWRFSIDPQGIAWAVLDREGESQNSLGRRPLEELAMIIERAEQGARDKSVRGLVFISGKEKGFIVGADVREFDQLTDERQVVDSIGQINGYLDRLERLPIPVVACIHGFCLGGGLELALACHWRIATRDEATRIGFPEVKLGLFPGFNGTVRSIRQAGALAAMPLMLTGSFIRASAARGMGLIDELAPSPLNLPWMARKAVQRDRRSKPAGGWRALARLWPARGLLAKKLRAETAKKVREEHYPSPFRLIDLFETHAGNFTGMKLAETRAFAPLMLGETSKNLRRVFRLSEMMKAQAPKGLAFKPLRVHVIGAGVMGADIAGWCVASGMEVSLQDVNSEQIAKGIGAQKKLFTRKFRTRPQRDAAIARLIADPTGANISRADVVIEAIVERLEAKQNLFRSIEGKLKPGAVLATNTSSIMIEEIAAPLADPGRLIGLHFFNPVAQLPLVEVIRGGQTREEEVGKGCAFVTAIDKFPLIVKSSPGFLVNRVLAPYMMAAMQRLERGEHKEKIDEAARSFGMPMGPIELADTVGLDVCAHVGKILKMTPSGPNQLEEMVAGGKLGKKSGEGFYVWKDGKPEKSKPETPYDKFELERLGRELV
ncbi:MAG: enoyl-CoA hydratase/isomerase family protein, partial [Hyphomicrobiaceae bacterium]|nr:enoyl-CoA hydratase/isomerase family protein [Hyphomicrobiaceae bacterium]